MIRHLCALGAAVFYFSCVGSPPTPCTDCNGVCVDLNTDERNCGECGRTCGAGKVCDRGTCKDTCPGSQTVCSGKCADTLSDNANCGTCGMACAAGTVCANGQCAASCGAPLAVCDDACVDTARNPNHCGECGRVCSPVNAAAATCVGGQCGFTSCTGFAASCDGNPGNGCETDTSSDVLNCGGCNVVCRPLNVRLRPVIVPDGGADAGSTDAGSTDAGSTDAGSTDAGSTDAGSTDAGSTDAGPVDAGAACGALLDGGLGAPCPVPDPLPGTTCINAQCDYEACKPGYGDCDGARANGCETSLMNDPRNCGACRRTCTGAGEACVGGECIVSRGSFLSPRNEVALAGNLSTSPRPMQFVLAPEPGATLYYTLDGTVPTPGAMGTSVSSTPAPLTLTYATLKWYAAYPDGRREPVRQYAHAIDTDTCTRGGIIEGFRFATSNAPVAVVSPGATVTGSFQQQYWTSQTGCYCPGCVTQWVLGVDGVGQVRCVGTGFGNTYPGTTNAQNFSFTAPTAPGRYLVRWGATDQLGCGSAGYPGGTHVGLLIVQ